MTTTITPTTEAEVTSSATWYSSSFGTFAYTYFAICYAPSGGTTLTQITDTQYGATAYDDAVSLSAALIPNGTWDVGLCSEADTSTSYWYTGSTTVVTGNYVPPGSNPQSAKVQPSVHQSGPPPRNGH